jgi:hypothetical protein
VQLDGALFMCRSGSLQKNQNSFLKAAGYIVLFLDVPLMFETISEKEKA